MKIALLLLLLALPVAAAPNEPKVRLARVSGKQQRNQQTSRAHQVRFYSRR